MPIKANAPKTSKPAAKSAAPKKASPTTTSAPKPAAPKAATDRFVPSSKESASSNPGKFSSFLDNVKGAFGQLGAASKPLEFSRSEREEGQKAAGTMQRLAGSDSTWEQNDLAANLAQLQTSGGFRGRIEGTVARNKLFDTHAVPEADRAGIIEQSRQIKQDNPNIAKLHKLEGMDPSKITDPEQRSRYHELKSQWTNELSEKGLLPVCIDQLQQMGDASEVLKERLGERGLEAPAGKPVDVEQFRGLFEGKAPLRTALGL